MYKYPHTGRKERTVKFCGKCGSSLPDNAKFCSKCGAAIQNRGIEEQQAEKRSKVDVPATSHVPSSAKRVQPVNKPAMFLVSMLIGTAVLFLLAWIIELQSGDFSMYVTRVANVGIKYLGSGFEPYSETAGRIVVWIAIVGIISTAYMLPLRSTRVIMKTVSLWDRFLIVIMCYFICAFSYFLIDTIRQPDMIKLFNNVAKVHKSERLLYILLLGVLVAILFGVGLFVFHNVKGIVALFEDNIKVNGIVGGICSALYDIFSSFFIVAAVLMVVCFGIAVAVFPLVLILGAMGGGRRVVYIDGEYYYVD